MDHIGAQKDILRILIASQLAHNSVSLDTGITRHAADTEGDDLAMDRHNIGTPGAAITAAQLLRELETITHEDFGEGRTYFYEGIEMKRDRDGCVNVRFKWGS